MFISHSFWNKGLITRNKIKVTKVLPDDSDRKSLPKMRETQVWSLDREISWRREWQPTTVFLPRKSHGQRRLADPNPWGHKESEKDWGTSTLILADPMESNMPGFSVLTISQFGQTHVNWVSDAIQPSCPLSSPFSSCLQSFPASGFFPMSQIFQLGG